MKIKDFFKKFTKSEDLKAAGIFVLIVVAILAVYNLCVYMFLFKPTFEKATKERTRESEIQFYAGEDNYNRHIADSEWFYAQKCPLIEITSYDGLKLQAFKFDAEPDLEKNEQVMGTLLLMHGFHSGPVREFATLAKFYHELNYNVIMPYQRAHGDEYGGSEGEYLTFGIKERYDCRDWIKKIGSLYGEELPLFVSGISMGCATITMTAGFEDLPTNVRGFIADCGFTSPKEIIEWTMLNDYGLPRILTGMFSFSGNWMAEHIAGFSLDEYSTQKALSVTEKPFLFITGTEDKTVPKEMSESNFMQYFSRNPEIVTLVEFEKTPHAISYMNDPEKYQTAVKKFLTQYGAK